MEYNVWNVFHSMLMPFIRLKNSKFKLRNHILNDEIIFLEYNRISLSSFNPTLEHLVRLLAQWSFHSSPRNKISHRRKNRVLNRIQRAGLKLRRSWGKRRSVIKKEERWRRRTLVRIIEANWTKLWETDVKRKMNC